MRRLASSPLVLRARREAVLRGPLRALLDRASSPLRLYRAVRFAIPSGAHQIPEEIGAFMEHARLRSPRTICEIGTAAGGTTALLTRVAPSVEQVIGLDLEIRNEELIRAIAPRHVDLQLLSASSLLPETRERVERLLAGRPLDLLFIDGSHTYDDARADFESFRGLVPAGGMIAFHDIVEDHFTRYGRRTEFTSDGVPRLWREVRERFTHHEFVRDPGQDAFGIGVIEHDPAVAL